MKGLPVRVLVTPASSWNRDWKKRPLLKVDKLSGPAVHDVVAALSLPQRQVLLRPHLQFPVFGHQQEILLAGDRILNAGAEQQQTGYARNERHPFSESVRETPA